MRRAADHQAAGLPEQVTAARARCGARPATTIASVSPASWSARRRSRSAAATSFSVIARSPAAALRDLGDRVTDPERTETALNEAAPGDRRDTSTPRALAGDLRAYVLGNALVAGDRAVLIRWLKGNTTGGELIRAGVPDGRQVGDKTGSGGYGTRNDIAVVWPPGRAPIVLAILSSRAEKDTGYDDRLIARATEVTLPALRP